MTRVLFGDGDDFIFNRNPEWTNIRLGGGNDHFEQLTSSMGEIDPSRGVLRINVNGGAGDDFISMGIPNPFDKAIFTTLYGDEQNGLQGNDYFAIGGSSIVAEEIVEFRVNGRGGSDTYAGHGGGYQAPAFMFNFNVRKDFAQMIGERFTSDEIVFRISDKPAVAGRVNVDIYEMEILGHSRNPITDGQWFHLERDPSKVRGTELAEDGHRDGVLLTTSVAIGKADYEGVQDRLDYMLNNGGFRWFNPDVQDII